MVFLAHLGVDLHVCLCGCLQAAIQKTLQFDTEIRQKDPFSMETTSVRIPSCPIHPVNPLPIRTIPRSERKLPGIQNPRDG